MKMNKISCWDDVLIAIRNKIKNPEAFQRFLMSHVQGEERKKTYKSVFNKQGSPFYLSIKSSCNLYLTPREAQCMALMMRGATNAQVAEKLGLSARTIEFYIKNMRQRLDCYSKAHLIETVSKTDFIHEIDSILEML